MKPVGIIPNPASGKDIRRLVAYGSVFDNHEKVNIVRRPVPIHRCCRYQPAPTMFFLTWLKAPWPAWRLVWRLLILLRGLIVKSLVDSSFDYLDAPIKTVGAGNTVIPFSPPLEDAMLPSEEKIVAAVNSVVG